MSLILFSDFLVLIAVAVNNATHNVGQKSVLKYIGVSLKPEQVESVALFFYLLVIK